ncbi:MAG: endolytic transglycosylase MltG [Candidatus Margulisiibacteriota bacterium]
MDKEINKPSEGRWREGAKSLAIILFVLITTFALTIPFLAKSRLSTGLYNVQIPENSTANQITDILYSKKIIASRLSFKIYINLFGISRKLQAGSYYLSPSMSNAVIAGKLAQGRVAAGDIKIIVPEGSSIYKISENIKKKRITIEDGNFEALSYNGIDERLRLKYPFLSGVPVYSLEGYLFPDTYFVSSRIKMDDLLEIMLDRFTEIVLPVYASSGTKYSLHEIITLASIVEKEAANEKERPIIASVFWNRLNNGIALRADPTVKYILENPTKRVMYNDLKTDSPYNTYLYRGLPPGPICNPGIASIYAVLHPARTKYLYFVSNGDGTHTFSENWGKHKEAADRFRKLDKK